jgi:TPR repeat protein
VRAGDRVPLAVRIEPRSTLLDAQAVVISGLPDEFTMEHASRNAQGAWVIAPAAIPDAMIRVPNGRQGEFELTYELIGIEGKVVTSAKTLLVVAARPPQRRIDGDEVVLLIKRGREMFNQGDIAGARLLLSRASESNSAEAAFALAETFDPNVLAARSIIGGVTGDPEEARKWYAQALALGVREAEARLQRLP